MPTSCLRTLAERDAAADCLALRSCVYMLSNWRLRVAVAKIPALGTITDQADTWLVPRNLNSAGCGSLEPAIAHFRLPSNWPLWYRVVGNSYFRHSGLEGCSNIHVPTYCCSKKERRFTLDFVLAHAPREVSQWRPNLRLHPLVEFE
jgi:hypothetical protein